MNRDRKCELAPSGKRCVYGDGTRLMCCACHRLCAASRPLLQEIPIFGEEFDDYECPTFEEEIYVRIN